MRAFYFDSKQLNDDFFEKIYLMAVPNIELFEASTVKDNPNLYTVLLKQEEKPTLFLNLLKLQDQSDTSNQQNSTDPTNNTTTNTNS